MDGLLRRRPDEAAQQVGARCFVKALATGLLGGTSRQVVRIEAGMVIVDTQNVDQEAGKDLDPQHEKAEVEEWLDVPLPLVGRVIGRKGERIREVCEASGADLRFDEAVSTLEMGGNTKRKTTGIENLTDSLPDTILRANIAKQWLSSKVSFCAVIW